MHTEYQQKNSSSNQRWSAPTGVVNICAMKNLMNSALSITLLGGCGLSNLKFPEVKIPRVYKIPVQQGNVITQEMVNQLKPGMSRRQVNFIMGTPLIKDTFNRNRWDYVFMIRNGSTVLEQSRVAVEFNEDTLVNVFGDFVSEDWAETGGTPTATSPSAEPASESSTYQ